MREPCRDCPSDEPRERIGTHADGSPAYMAEPRATDAALTLWETGRETVTTKRRATPPAKTTGAVYEYTWSRRRIAEDSECLSSPEAAARFLAPLFDGAESERLIVVLLTRKHRPMAVETVYTGTVTGMSVRIGELLRAAVRLNAPALMIAHNHPSGDPTPSAEDIRTTRDTVAAGKLLGIDVLDHIVMGDGRWVSVGQGQSSDPGLERARALPTLAPHAPITRRRTSKETFAKSV